jgi:fatty acid desaturase
MLHTATCKTADTMAHAPHQHAAVAWTTAHDRMSQVRTLDRYVGRPAGRAAVSEGDPARDFLRQARAIIQGLNQPNPWIYWSDFLSTTALGYLCGLLYLRAAGPWWHTALAFVVCGFALFRTGSFIHEIQHLRQGTLTGFKAAWNLLCGVPLMMPSFLYDNHASHHRRSTYGTERDGEYLPLGSRKWQHFANYVTQVFWLPLAVFFRFLVLSPASLASWTLRRFVHERFSFYGINTRYRHLLPPSQPRAWWIFIEACCTLRVWLIVIGVATGWTPWVRPFQLYAMAVFVLGLNYVRNVVAHRYRNLGGEMTYLEQLCDSINITGRTLLTELFFPLGLRYHALHHLFPSLPYHHLGEAHRRLMAELPPDSPYRRTVYPTFWAALGQLRAPA